MTATEIINVAKIALQQESGATGIVDDATFLDILNEGYVDFCRFTKARTKLATNTIPAYYRGVTLPSDFLEAQQARWSYNRQLGPKTERELDYRQTNWKVEVGTPENFVYWNWDFMRVRPMPSSAGTVSLKYFYIPTELASGDTPSIPETYHVTLSHFIVSECSVIARDFETAIEYYGKYTEERKDAKKQAQEGQRSPDTMFAQVPLSDVHFDRVERGRW